ncbi:hypothetical protein AMTRI_Chr07g23590 [Amborella trichopoda]
MISILSQERLLGATLGAFLATAIVCKERRNVYASISDSHSKIITKSSEPMFGKKFRSDLAHLWNRGVDKTLGPVIVSLSSKGW